MAKQPETRDRFRITAEVEAAELGPLLAQLARIGLQNIGYELITDVVTYNRNGQRATPGQSGELARAWIADHPTFMIGDLANHFKENGYSKASGYAAAHRLTAEGLISNLGSGSYARTDVKAAAPPPAAEPAKQFKNGIDLIRDFVKNRKTVDTKQLKTLFEQHGRRVAAAHQCVHEMVNNKELKRTGKLGSGQYEVTKKVKPTPVSFADLNGSGAHAEEQAHGS